MIAGIDFSTKAVHLVRRPPGDEAPLIRKITLSNWMAYAERDAIAAREAAQAVQADPEFWQDVWLCGIEYPFTFAKAMGSIGLKSIMGALIASVPEHVHVIALPARLWTPWFLRVNRREPLPKVPAKSDARKPLIRARALQMLGCDDVYEQDAYDALGISVAVELINAEALDGVPTRPGPTMKTAA